MSTVALRLRRTALVVAAVSSAIACLTLIWVFAPLAFSSLRTVELLVMFALAVGPFMTVWAVLQDRKSAQQLPTGPVPAPAPSDDPLTRAIEPGRLHEPGRVVRPAPDAPKPATRPVAA